ncbi:hypothetical protein LPJ61_004796, partial [Coemansia biformis]
MKTPKSRGRVSRNIADASSAARTTRSDAGAPRLISRSGHTSTLAYQGVSSSMERKRREGEAKQQVGSRYFCHSHHRVLSLTRPRNLSVLALSDAIGKQVVANLEHHIGPVKSARNEKRKVKVLTVAKVRDGDMAIRQALVENNFRVPRATLAADRRPFALDLLGDFGGMQPLVVSGNESPSDDNWNERAMYPWLQSLFLFVARHIKHYLEGVADGRLPDRLVLPYERTDVLAEGSDDRKRPDLGLGIR